MPKVTLITHTPDPEMTIASAARLCYSPATIAEVQEKLTPEKAGEFVEMLAGLGHQSPIEHAVFTFGIEGVSRALLAQITRHRIASFSVQSQRYVRENDFEVVVPPQIAEVPEAKAEFELAMRESIAHYQKIAELLKSRRERELLEQGLSPKAAASRAEKNRHRGRPVCAAQCLRYQDDRDHERPQPYEFLRAALLPARPVGDKRGCGSNAAAVSRGRAPSVPKGGAGLCTRRLPRGQNDLRNGCGNAGKIR